MRREDPERYNHGYLRHRRTISRFRNDAGDSRFRVGESNNRQFQARACLVTFASFSLLRSFCSRHATRVMIIRVGEPEERPTTRERLSRLIGIVTRYSLRCVNEFCANLLSTIAEIQCRSVYSKQLACCIALSSLSVFTRKLTRAIVAISTQRMLIIKQ